ncbi:cation efflux family protein [Spathaspora passalidarum NRRL Y-27907]|uniref:Cation efflux family protein n=1 Tax=Spathaspora passalidarum (strain NRRL Y-27907 / 11-Y1) TaxID=619300 RepID=G3AJZ6_SPAPN|nr:cation efflux family protein [Spathaspora passalidarum NRRL Y-27907]EGW34047.1 cation efflux family protein [Spathaspora passalidarum NRRL Y-27907]
MSQEDSTSTEYQPLLPSNVQQQSTTNYGSTRRYSFTNEYNRSGERPLFQRILSSYHSVTNPNSPFENIVASQQQPVFQDNQSISSSGEYRRMSVVDIVNALRPARLIGKWKPLANWYDYYISDLEKIKSRSVRSYYEEQNELIEKFQEIDNFLDAGKIHYNMLTTYGQPNTTVRTKYSRLHDVPGNIDQDVAKLLGYDEDDHQSQVLTAILVNFLINILLLIGKIVVTILTNSMSVVASLVDSILDFLSTFIIYIVNRLATSKDWKVQHSYPVGRSRLEPLGILIFSIIIIISFVQVGQESFKKLFMSPADSHVPAVIGFDAIAIMTITIIAKVGCWIWCSSSRSSSVQALAQDAMTDIVFNTVSLLMPALGHWFNIWWFDPLGALLLSIYIVVNWGMTAFEHINNLTGAVAEPVDYKVILYLAYRFAEPIKQITALKVYHVGDNLNVEIDLVFANDKFDLSFKDCHDIAEALQYSIESLPNVERAFVHIDYMEGNYKGHLK